MNILINDKIDFVTIKNGQTSPEKVLFSVIIIFSERLIMMKFRAVYPFLN